MKKIVIIGKGKLAEAILTRFPDFSEIPVEEYGQDIEANHDTIFVHVGSGRQYGESLQRAIENDASYIQAATEKNITMKIPDKTNITFINAPNLDTNIIKLFHVFKCAKGLFKDEQISIIESHQKEKTSLPGTAVKFCDFLGIPYERIESIRDPERQKELDISNLKQHAYHKIRIGDNSSSITIETKIEGLESYVKGLSKIVQCVPMLKNGTYEIEDLIDLEIL